MDSWRLIFVDIDQSFNIPVADSAIQGYMVVRAPKGSTEAMYFPKGSTNQIKAMLGIATADWPDIQDALDVNGSYGLWISAPPGTSATYPSYYGGVYLTKNGLFPFYQVSDRNNPNFQALVSLESEDQSYLHMGGPSSNVQLKLGPRFPTELTSSGDPIIVQHDSISIGNVPPVLLSTVTGINFDFWGNSNSQYSGAANYQLAIRGSTIQATSPGSGDTVLVGQVSPPVNGTKTVNIVGGEPITSSFMYLDFTQLVDPTPYITNATVGGVVTLQWISSNAQTEYMALLHAAIVNSLQWIVDVTDTTYMTIAQKTPTEKETYITISDIGYDKYGYDYALDAYHNISTTPGSLTSRPIPDYVENASGLYVVFNQNTALGPSGIYQSTGPATTALNVTTNYRNRYIRIKNSAYVPTAIGAVYSSLSRDPKGMEYIDQIYYVNATGVLQLVATQNAVNAPSYPSGEVTPRLAPNYNQVTFSVVEDVYPGDRTSGGTFTGSLSQTGTDTYGGNIYFPSILPENAVSDVDVAVYNTFDKDLDENNFYLGYEIIDPRIFNMASQGSANQQLPTSVTTGELGQPAVKGQRFVTSLVNGLIGAGKTGGTIDPDFDFTTLLTAGWTEASKGIYEPCMVFAEPTGIEALKEILYSLRKSTHKVSTFVSPRLIDTSESIDPHSIVVSGRLAGTAQLVNQALRRDTFTGAKYWTSLVGAYAAELLYIIDGKLGGWAPMWTNIAGYGGQLPVTVDKMQYEFTQEQLQALDEIGLNPITLDPTYGLMVTSQKTTQDPTNLSDWSYLGHSMAFDLFKREVRDNVMVPQIGKPNDPYYQSMRQRQVEAILNRRTGGAEPIWAAGKVEVANVNTDDVKAQRKFAIRVSVKVNVFSELVELTFINVAQTTQI